MAIHNADFLHGLRLDRVMLFPVPGCSRILQLSAYYADSTE
jgi:hypothetical protein